MLGRGAGTSIYLPSSSIPPDFYCRAELSVPCAFHTIHASVTLSMYFLIYFELKDNCVTEFCFYSSLSRMPFTLIFLENISLASKIQFRIYFANLLLIQSMFSWMLFFLVQHCLRYLAQKHHFCNSGSLK